MELLPRLRNGLDGNIKKTLRVSYDRLDRKDQDIFLYIACLFNGERVSYIKDLLGDSVSIGLRMLAYNCLIHISPSNDTVQMHSLLEKLGKEIVREESINNPGKRRFLVDAEDIFDVFTDNTGTENMLGMCLNTSEINEPLFIDGKSFEGMRNLQFLKVHNRTSKVKVYLPQGLLYLPRKLKLLYWDEYLLGLGFVQLQRLGPN